MNKGLTSEILTLGLLAVVELLKWLKTANKGLTSEISDSGSPSRGGAAQMAQL